MVKTLDGFGDFVAGRRVILFGNAQSVLTQTIKVSSDDVIVRINLGADIARKHENIGGSRTDILLISGFIDRLEDFLSDYRTVVWMTPKMRQEISPHHAEQLFYYPVSWWKELHEQIGSRPSTGCMAIDLILRFIGRGALHIYGFDFWRTGSNYTGKRHVGPHDPAAEEAFVNSHVASGRVKLPS